MADSLPDADAVRRALERRFLIYGPSAEVAMAIVAPVLEEYAREITRLEAVCAQVSGDAPVAGAPG